MAERPLQQPQYRTIIPPIKKEEEGPIPETQIGCDRDCFQHLSHPSHDRDSHFELDRVSDKISNLQSQV